MNEARSILGMLSNEEAFAIENVAKKLAAYQEATAWPELGEGTRAMWIHRAKEITDIVNEAMS